MSKLGFLVAVSVVSLGAAVGAWYYKYQLYGWLPSTASSELKNVDGLLMDKEVNRLQGVSKIFQIPAILFMPIKTASLTDSMWSSVKVNFVRSDIGKMASKMAFLKPGQTKVC